MAGLGQQTSLKVLNKTGSDASVRLVPEAGIERVHEQIIKAETNYDRDNPEAEISLQFGDIGIGGKLERGRESGRGKKSAVDVEVEFGSLRQAVGWQLLDVGSETTLHSYTPCFISIYIEGGKNKALNRPIDPSHSELRNGIVLVKANPPFVPYNTYLYQQINTKAKPFRLQNIRTGLVLTALRGVGQEASVVLQRKIATKDGELPDPSQQWIEHEDILCPIQTFRLVPVAFPHLTLRVHKMNLVLSRPTTEIGKPNAEEEASYEQWEMTPSYESHSCLFRFIFGCSGCCEPPVATSDVFVGRRGSAEYGGPVTLSCVGLSEYLVCLSNDTVVMKKIGYCDRTPHLWQLSEPIATAGTDIQYSTPGAIPG
mmetsp:Transcript_7500/g.18331  ORF Transcript_7500/g.18331 Transcript_7500/m.18331 type:complete len:370 (-) Transcript_7500:759-1868(-)